MSLYEDKLSPFRLWQDTIFQVEDLLDFLGPEGPHSALYKASEKRTCKYGDKLYKKCYSLPVNKTIGALKEKYPLVEITAAEANSYYPHPPSS